MSTAHAAAGVPSIALVKCQQEFKTTPHSSTELKDLGSGDDDESIGEQSDISHTIRHAEYMPHTHLPPSGPLEQAW